MLALVRAAVGDVDSGSTDYSRFRGLLRKVDRRQQSSGKQSLEEQRNRGAIQICQTLAGAREDIRCPALVYVFEAIDRSAAGDLKIELNERIFEGIAHVVANSVEARQPLTEDGAKTFMQVISSLESRKPTSDVERTIFDLSACLLWSYSDNEEINKFFSDPKRSSHLDNYLNNRERPTQDLEQSPKPVDANYISQAQTIVSQIGLSKQLAPVAKITPDEGSPKLSGQSGFDPAQLAMLKMIKMRVEAPSVNRYERKLPVNYRLASEFAAFWSNLVSAKLYPSEPLDKNAIEFRNDPKNSKLAASLKDVHESYGQLRDLLQELKLELEEFGDDSRTLIKVGILLSEAENWFARIEDSIDVRPLRPTYEESKSKYEKLSTIEKFINSW